MPLPSNPTIYKGETSSFDQVTGLVNSFFDVTVNSQYMYRRRYFWGLYLTGGSFGAGGGQSLTITFQQTVGVHFLTVVKADNSTDLTEWLDWFLEDRGYDSKLPAGLENLAEKYIEDGINYFVVDLIDTNSTAQTVNPLTYRFQTSMLYYPLRVSTLFSGDTSISLFTISKDHIKSDAVFGGQFSIGAQFQITREACKDVCANFTELFSGDPYMYYLTYRGPQQNFSADLNAEAQFVSDSSTLVAASMGLVFGLTLLVLVFAPKIESVLDVQLPADKRLQIVFSLTGLLGLGLIWVGFFCPWGLRNYGGVLLSVDGSSATSQSSGGIFYVLFLLSAVACYVYLLLIAGYSKIAATHFAVVGGSITLMLGVAGAVSLRTLSTGVYLTMTGCAFVGLAGFVSFRRLRLDTVPRHEMTSFRRYVIRRFLISMLTLFAVFVVIFYLLTLLPVGFRIGMYP